MGRFRLPRITNAVERFLQCGDYTKGIARIQCTNPGCRAEYFRPFSCKVFHLCPSCSQKRTLLFGEYMNERLLLRLPHRQKVFTFPKVLRGFFRHHRTLYGEIARQVYAMISLFYNAVAGCKLRSAAVIAYASAGEFVRFNPHLHAIVLEGGFEPLRAVLFPFPRNVAAQAPPGTPRPRGMETRACGARRPSHRPRGTYPEASVACTQSRAVWARLIAKVYEADPLICRRCASPMRGKPPQPPSQ